jgi:hypothetical protein
MSSYLSHGSSCIGTFSRLMNPNLRAKLFFFLSPNDLINLLVGDSVIVRMQLSQTVDTIVLRNVVVHLHCHRVLTE